MLIIIRVIDQSCEIVAARPVRPGFFYGNTIEVLIRNVQKTDAIGTEQPLVACRHQKIRSCRFEIERACAQSLGYIQRDPDTKPVQCIANDIKIQRCAVRPVMIRQRGDRDVVLVRCYGLHHGSGPVQVRGRIDNTELSVVVVRQSRPRVVVRWKLISKQQYLLLRFHADIFRRTRDSVTCRRNDGDIVRIGSQQPGKQAPKQLHVVEEVGCADLPRGRAPTQPRLASLRYDLGMRPHVGGVQIAHIPRDRKKRSG